MKKIHRILLFVAVTCVLIVSATLSPVFAQDGNEPEGFKNVRLWVFPEYDDPRLLVMLEGKIVGAQAPVTVRFLVPSAAEMNSAGSMDSLGQYSGGPPDREPSAISGWDEISYVVTSDIFRVEYYDPIIIGQTDKTIRYEFYGLYPISDLRVIVQEPRKSTIVRCYPRPLTS